MCFYLHGVLHASMTGQGAKLERSHSVLVWLSSGVPVQNISNGYHMAMMVIVNAIESVVAVPQCINMQQCCALHLASACLSVIMLGLAQSGGRCKCSKLYSTACELIACAACPAVDSYVPLQACTNAILNNVLSQRVLDPLAQIALASECTLFWTSPTTRPLLSTGPAKPPSCMV